MGKYKKNITILTLISLIFIISITSAAIFEYNTAINVRDSPNKELIIKTLNADTGTTIRSIPITIGSSGVGSAEFQTNIPNIMAIIYEIKNKSDFLKPENIISTEGAGPFDASQAINLNFVTNQHNIIPGSEPEVNDTEEIIDNSTEEIIEEIEPVEETVIEEEPETINEGLTGNVIDDVKSNFKFPTHYYFIGVGLLAMLITSMVLKKKLSKKTGKDFKVKDKGEILDPDEEERELEDAEQRIKDAEEEISRIRNNKGKIRDAEKKFLESKAELEKLKKSE